MKILITGSTGFVGSYLLNKLSKKDSLELILPVRNSKRLKPGKNIQIVPFTENLDRLVLEYKPDTVINLLGILTEIPEKNITFEKVHFEYTKKLVDGAKKANVKKFVQMSALGADINAKSRYQKTKALAEKYLKESGVNYVIFRPSIIIGRGQKLFEDFKKLSKFSPFFIAPKGKVQPVHILDVVDCFEKTVFEDINNKTLELCGDKIISYKELFEFALKVVNIKRPVFEVNRAFLLPIALIGTVFGKPLTYDQWLMLEKDNVCSRKNTTCSITRAYNKL